MNTKKQIRYRLPVSTYFPAKHLRKGEQTGFIFNILTAIKRHDLPEICDPKIHTLRTNYPLWKKRFEKIDRGEAVLELYYWSEKPYKSKTVTFCQLTKDDGIGIQQLENPDNFVWAQIDGKNCNWGDVAKNDGLSFVDFCDWFKVRQKSPLAIIHFTNFRY